MERARNPPYIFLSSGEQEPLREPITRFESELTRHHIPHTYHIQPGAHDWNQWNAQLSALIATLDTK